jgi:hypothetical protein
VLLTGASSNELHRKRVNTIQIIRGNKNAEGAGVPARGQ